jgi:tRNA-dihydrouridine synthase B
MIHRHLQGLLQISAESDYNVTLSSRSCYPVGSSTLNLISLEIYNLLHIGKYKINSYVVLAPMAGVTDKPFRDLCESLGTRLMVSEMVASQKNLWHTEKSRKRLVLGQSNSPNWVQIAGGDPLMLKEAARMVAEKGAQIIDINMGCPARKVCRKAAGSALLKDLGLVEEILTTVVQAVDVPVTLKMRTGWSRQNRNGLAVAHIAEQSGIAALSVHGRTRECGFTGSAEFDTIAMIKSAVNIPVIANGDIDSIEAASTVIEHTRADGVMIGRAAQGNPWLPGSIDQYLRTGERSEPPTIEEIGRCFKQHITSLHDFYGEHSGVRIARKHLGWYLRTREGSDDFRCHFNTIDTAAEQINTSNMYFGLNDRPLPAITDSNSNSSSNQGKEMAA